MSFWKGRIITVVYPQKTSVQIPFPTQEANRKISGQEIYLGIDSRYLYCSFALRELRRNEKRYHISCADTEYLPLPDNSVSEIVFSNILSYHPVWPKREQIIKESKRVLKRNGQLMVVETITPQDFPLESATKLLEKENFVQSKEKLNIKDYCDAHEDPPIYPKGIPFIAAFRKK